MRRVQGLSTAHRIVCLPKGQEDHRDTCDFDLWILSQADHPPVIRGSNDKTATTGPSQALPRPQGSCQCPIGARIDSGYPCG